MLSSLEHFRPSYMSLSTPHPLWTSAHSPYEVQKAVIQAWMISGRYCTDKLARHWSSRNPSGLCLLPGCDGLHVGSLEHILLHCQALADVGSGVINLWTNFMVSRQYLLPVVAQHTIHHLSYISSSSLTLQPCHKLLLLTDQTRIS